MSDTQLAFLASKLPEPKSWTGRPAYTNSQLLPGILRVLRSGCRWRDLNFSGYPSSVSHWRRLQFWKQKKHFRHLWEHLLRLLRDKRKLILDRLSLDGSLLQSFAFKECTGYSGKHKKTGVKVSVITEGTGVPIAMVTAKGNIVDISLAPATVNAIRIAKGSIGGAKLLGDKGYDCFRFRRYASDYGMFPHIPRRKNTKVKERWYWCYMYNKDEGRKRFVIERTNAWLKSFRRLRMRFDYKVNSFEAFLYLAIIVICVRRLFP